jgi:hypothetical protein
VLARIIDCPSAAGAGAGAVVRRADRRYGRCTGVVIIAVVVLSG